MFSFTQDPKPNLVVISRNHVGIFLAHMAHTHTFKCNAQAIITAPKVCQTDRQIGQCHHVVFALIKANRQL